ncbi:hypothetical protein [Nocardia caishijiensis]|uniref:hypothetical protein n=1 Tax=Nocardia caishijiensis TaxID=184756 RepID=UPI0012EEADA6|nr:hypothetical protein [Nocardia caishijiensis]
MPVVSTYFQLKDYADGSKPTRSMDESPDATIARNRLTELSSVFDGQYQKPQVTEGSYKDPRNMDDLYDRVSAMSITDVSALHTRWETLRNRLETGLKTYDSEIQKAIAEKWTGGAAASAGAGIADYVSKSSNLLTSAQMMAEKVKLVQSAMQVTKDRAKPHDGSFISGVASWIPGPTWKMNTHNADTAKTEAAELVEGVFYQAVRKADEDVPLVPQPYNPVDPGANPGGNNGDPGSTTGKPSTDTPTTQNPTTELPTTEEPTTEEPTTEDPSDDEDTGDTSTPETEEPAAVTPQNTLENPTSPAGTPGSTLPTGTGGSPGTGSPGGSSPGSGVPGAGTSMPGTPGGATAGKSGASAGSGAGTSGRAGMPGMGAMGGGGARGKGDDDNESKTKDYLINQQNGEELTGLAEDQRVKTVPPVIGE